MKTLSNPIDLIKESLKIFFEKKNMMYFFKIYSVAFALSLCSFVFSSIVSNAGYTTDQYVQEFLSGNPLIISLVFIWSIAAFLIGIWAQVSGYEAIRRVVKGGALEFKDTFRGSWKYLGSFFLVNFLVGLIVVLGLVLLVVPGIIFSVWYAFSVWMVVDKNYGVKEALRQSKSLAKDRFWKILGRFLVFILFGILGQIVFSLMPQGYGTVVASLFGALFIIPNFLLYQELSK